MVNVVSNIIGSLAMFLSSVYVWKKLYKTNINWTDFRIYLITAFMIFFGLINYFYNIVFVRIFILTIFLFFSNKFIFRKNYKETILSTILSEFIICVSDILFGLVVIYIMHVDLNNISAFYGTLFANLFVLIMCFGISNFRFFNMLYLFLIKIVDRSKKRKIILFSLLSIISLNILLALIYYKLNTYSLLIINTILILIYSYVIVKNFETSNKNQIISARNSSLLLILHQYEDMVDRQRVDNHENKNQLLIIKNMIKKNDKDVVKYIDTIVKDKKEDDEVLYTRVKTIPSGGLQGIIYQKMLTMKDEKILFSLDVSRDVRKIDLDSLSMDDNYKLCKIIGVFLDNAIEESRSIKDKCIMISLYVDDENLIIEISNRFNNEIDIDKIDDEGYTTKGDGHGYGLSLVKKIVSESDVFENERIVNKDIFKQVIKVKIKNT